MARPGIEKNAVFEAAAALQAEGLRATVQNVRDRVGSGSFSTISSYLSEWKAAQSHDQAPVAPEMPDRVQAAFKQVWNTAAQDAEARLAKERDALEAVQRELAAEKTELTAEIERLEAALEEQTHTADIAAAERDELKDGLLTAQEQNTALTIDNTKMTEQVKAQTARGDEMSRRLTPLEARLTQEREASEAVRRDLGDMVTEKAELAAEIKRLKEASEEQARVAKISAAECDELKRVGQGQEKQINALTLDNTRLQEQLSAAKTRGDEFNDQIKALRADFTAAMKAVDKGAAAKPSKGKSQAAGPGAEPES